jgi:hypothetical protein
MLMTGGLSPPRMKIENQIKAITFNIECGRSQALNLEPLNLEP